MKPEILISLIEIMRDFEAWRFAELVHRLAQYRWIASSRKADGPIHDQVVGELRYILDEYFKQCKKINLPASVACIEKRLHPRLLGAYGKMEWGELDTELSVLWDALGPEMATRRFASVADSKAVHLDEMLERKKNGRKLVNPWDVVWQRFPSAREDVEEAVYSYALERNIACIFHLMRVAEVGMRGLARRLKIKLPGGKPLEWANWNAILSEMNKKIEILAHTMKSGPVKDETMEFYRGCLGQFYAFKDEYRNHVSHKRKSYNEHQAASVLSHVHGFMQKLSARTDEMGRNLKKSGSAGIILPKRDEALA